MPVAAVLGQEHHARGDAWVDLKANTKRAGWLTTGAAAARAEGGLGKVGVSVSVRNSFATGTTKHAKHDCSPKDSPGRLTTAWVDGVMRGGVLLVSVYLWVEEGFTDRNRAI